MGLGPVAADRLARRAGPATERGRRALRRCRGDPGAPALGRIPAPPAGGGVLAGSARQAAQPGAHARAAGGGSRRAAPALIGLVIFPTVFLLRDTGSGVRAIAPRARHPLAAGAARGDAPARPPAR